ncbi:MAG: thioredoxin domain-containing protein [Candidatus Thorarchaeota archaeon]|jgi:thioredoxin 1
MLGDDDLKEIRRRKMELMVKRAQQEEVLEPLANGVVHPLFEADFWQTIQKTKTAIVDFYGDWCMPCKTLAPIMADLATDYKGKVFFAKVDIDRNVRIAVQFGVQSVPMVFAFKNGAPVHNLPGLRRYDDYDIWIEALLKLQPASQ